LFQTSTLRIIWALGTSDPQGDDIEPSDYHGNSAENRGNCDRFLLLKFIASFDNGYNDEIKNPWKKFVKQLIDLTEVKHLYSENAAGDLLVEPFRQLYLPFPPICSSIYSDVDLY